MKMNLKAKDFAKKEELQKSLSTLLKKPLMALLSGKVDKLPFCYEAEYFDDGSGFMSIGVAKEVDKLFKTKRSKGQGQGDEGKIDKKKVAFGVCRLSPEGSIEFCVLGGLMKPMEAKKCIKSIPILKKKVGDKYIISKGEAEIVNEEAGAEEEGQGRRYVETRQGTEAKRARSFGGGVEVRIRWQADPAAGVQRRRIRPLPHPVGWIH